MPDVVVVVVPAPAVIVEPLGMAKSTLSVSVVALPEVPTTSVATADVDEIVMVPLVLTDKEAPVMLPTLTEFIVIVMAPPDSAGVIVNVPA